MKDFKLKLPGPYENGASFKHGMHRNASDNMLPKIQAAPRAQSGLHKNVYNDSQERNQYGSRVL